MQKLPRACALLVLLLASAFAQNQITIKRQPYRGWPDALVLGNGTVEAVIVPASGRVQQFRFVNEDGVFWESAEWAGKLPDAQSATWANFGGDKSWPAPQSDWPKVTPRAWPPPAAFDAMPVQATIKDREVELISPVDPHYGIRVIRRVRLDAKRPVLTITTTYEKVSGAARPVAIWIITQLNDPQMIYVPLPAQTINPQGYVLQSKNPPPSLQRTGNLLALTRDKQTSYKIGTDAGTLLWLGERHTLRIDSPRVPKAAYPDQGSSAEVYTNLDPQAYVELEMLGPLGPLRVGERRAQTNTYTLARRQLPDALAEARRLLGLRR